MSSNTLKTNNFRMISLSKWMLLGLAVAIIGILASMAWLNESTIIDFISGNIGFNIIFMVGMIHILSFIQLYKIENDFRNSKNIEENIFSLIIILLVQMSIFNYILVALIMLSLYKYIDKNTLNFKSIFSVLGRGKEVIGLYASLFMFMLLVGILYTTIFCVI